MGVNPRRLRFIGRPAGRSAFRSVAKRPNYAGIGDEEADSAVAGEVVCEKSVKGRKFQVRSPQPPGFKKQITNEVRQRLERSSAGGAAIE